MIVVDASTVFAALVRPGASRERLMADDLYAPHLVDLEVVSALRRLVLVGRIEAGIAAELVGRLRALGITRYPAFGLTERIWELRDTLTAYDAAYVAFAEALGCTLLTADARLAGAPGIRCSVAVLPT